MSLEYPDWVDELMPPAGPCAFCGGTDKRHRVIDAMVECVRAGDPVDFTAENYGYPTEFVQRLIDEGLGVRWK